MFHFAGLLCRRGPPLLDQVEEMRLAAGSSSTPRPPFQRPTVGRVWQAWTTSHSRPLIVFSIKAPPRYLLQQARIARAGAAADQTWTACSQRTPAPPRTARRTFRSMDCANLEPLVGISTWAYPRRARNTPACPRTHGKLWAAPQPGLKLPTERAARSCSLGLVPRTFNCAAQRHRKPVRSCGS